MTRPIFVVDAFASGPFRGNPAAVVLLEPDDVPTIRWMQSVAAEMKHSETAYVTPRPDGEFDLRWFTPEVEVDLCGHATLASGHVLWEAGRLAPDAGATFHTRGGVLRATRPHDGAVQLDFPTAPPDPCDAPVGLLAAIGIEKAETLSTTGQFFMLVVPDAATVRDCAPDFVVLGALRDVARRVRDRARRRRRARHRVALRAARRHRRGPGHGLDALRARAVLVRAPGPDRAVRRAGLRARRLGALPGRGRPHAAHRQRDHRPARLARRTHRGLTAEPARATPARVPGELRGEAVAERHVRLPPEHLARVVDRAPPLRNESPAIFGPGSIATGGAREVADQRSLSVISAPPARFTYVPGDASASAAARFPATMSLTNVNSRIWVPSPYAGTACRRSRRGTTGGSTCRAAAVVRTR